PQCQKPRLLPFSFVTFKTKKVNNDTLAGSGNEIKSFQHNGGTYDRLQQTYIDLGIAGVNLVPGFIDRLADAAPACAASAAYSVTAGADTGSGQCQPGLAAAGLLPLQHRQQAGRIPAAAAL